MTHEPSFARKALTTVILAAGLFAAVVIQLTVINRLPLPGTAAAGSGGAPDLVLLLVAAIAVATGPATGAVTGFAGGLALDIAPPAAHYAGEYALVFCLVGYVAARVARTISDTTGEHDPLVTVTVLAIAVAAGEAGKAAIGMLISDPDVSSAAVSRLLPGAVLYDLLLLPLVYWPVARVTRGAVGWRATRERAPAPEFGLLQPAPAFRQASSGWSSATVPKLRLAGTGESYLAPPPARRIPRLRLSGAPSASDLRASAAALSRAPLPLAGARAKRMDFTGSRPAPVARPAARTPGKNWLRSPSPAVPAARPAVRTPGKNWLRSSSPAVPAARRTVRSPARGWLRAAGGAGLAAGTAGRRAPARPRRFANGTGGTAHAASSPLGRPSRSAGEALAARSAPSGVSALAGAGTPLARRRTPSRGWLRGSGTALPSPAQRRLSPRRGWLGSASRRRTVIGSRVGGRGRPFRRARGSRGNWSSGGNWYAGTPSGAWLRRGRHSWRRRLHLPGRRPPVSPGARATASRATGPRAPEPRLFGLLGGRR